jgi:transmembrane sensor
VARQQIAADPALAKLFEALESARLDGIDSTTADVDAALRRVKMKMRAAPRRSPTRIWLPMAATLVIAAGIFWYTRSDRMQPAAVAVAAPQVFRTGIGARDSILLADGSRVILGPRSELTVDAGFPLTRNVALRGQARFDVVHDASRLFTVRTAQAVVTDLGTTFTINDFDGAAIDVSVQSGSVRLSTARSSDNGVILTAGDAGTVNTRGVLTRTSQAASDEDLAWMSGRLVFRETPYIKVRAELRRWYGIELVTTDSVIATGHLNATFRDEPLSQVLEVIALAFGAKHQTHGDTVILLGARRTPGR